MFCKVCYDTGKDEKVYTSHYPRETIDKDSQIICPTLLSLNCKYCKQKGHTIKYCKVLREKTEFNPFIPVTNNNYNKFKFKPLFKKNNDTNINTNTNTNNSIDNCIDEVKVIFKCNNDKSTKNTIINNNFSNDGNIISNQKYEDLDWADLCFED